MKYMQRRKKTEEKFIWQDWFKGGEIDCVVESGM